MVRACCLVCRSSCPEVFFCFCPSYRVACVSQNRNNNYYHGTTDLLVVMPCLVVSRTAAAIRFHFPAILVFIYLFFYLGRVVSPAGSTHLGVFRCHSRSRQKQSILMILFYYRTGLWGLRLARYACSSTYMFCIFFRALGACFDSSNKAHTAVRTCSR